jgi:peroxiredoxin
MNKVLLGCAMGAIITIIFFFIKFNPLPIKQKEAQLAEVPIYTIGGDSLILNKETYSSKLILNFYGTACGLCLTEINDIVSFSRKHKVSVLFVTADSVEAIKKFTYELKKQGITDERISFAQISLPNAKKLFGDLTVPQSIVIGNDFRTLDKKKGIITYSFLKRCFEKS